MDPIFEEEQQHLTDTYAKLTAIETELSKKLSSLMSEASDTISTMRDEITLNLSDDGQASETTIEIDSLNTIIDAYNLSNDINTEKLRSTQVLLKQPYFAKVGLQFRPGAPVKNIYIGAAGMTDDSCRHFIVDWRSPVAEVYYNQENGPTSYKADDRTIHVDLKLRRQFDIDKDKLNAYFDTTVAIEDPLLLASLTKHRSAHMQNITMTIQKEQNQVIRHEDVPVLLVNGIAGSGKTSVLLQRIAYLFYQFRETLNPENVCLITPNPVFQRYINNVLPDMGEANPQTLTFKELMEHMGLGNRGEDASTTVDILRAIDASIEDFMFNQNDFNDIKLDREIVIPASQTRSIYNKFSHLPAGPRLIALISEELHDRLEARVKGLIKSDKTHSELLELSLNEQLDIFGYQIHPQSEEDFRELAAQYLEVRYAPIYTAIENADWLRIDHIGMRLLNQESLTPTEWIYLKLALTGEGDRAVKFVMVDEVQDYSTAQLMMLGRYYSNAHFLLLGDENQAIKPGTASFPEIHDLFSRTHGKVSECRLLTSYRSSPEITALFASLLDEDARIQISSVQRSGVEPTLAEFSSQEEYVQALHENVQDLRNESGLTAIIAPTKKQAKRTAQLFDDLPENERPQLMLGNKPLPDQGIVILELALAKGLEFDRVIIVDATDTYYPDDLISRRRLYTAISRATQHVTLFAQGSLTGLLKH